LGQPTECWRYTAPRIAGGQIVLTSNDDANRMASIVAWVRGVPIGRSVPPPVGDESRSLVRIGCDRFPLVDLPAEVRFSYENEDSDICEPLAVTEADVFALVGRGDPHVIKTEISHGVMTGAIANTVNGVYRPVLIGRIASRLLRDVVLSSPLSLPEGGVQHTFSLPILVADLQGAATTYEILLAPELRPLVVMEVRSQLSGMSIDDADAIAGLVADLEQRLGLALARAEAHADDRARRQSLLIERVVSYLSALIFDELNTGRKTDRASEFVHAVMREARDDQEDTSASLMTLVPADSPYFASGWSAPGAMRAAPLAVREVERFATVINPDPQRALASISVTVVDEPGALETVRLLLDGVPILQAASAGSAGDGPWSLVARFDPGSETICSIVSLILDADAPPVAVADVKFTYVRARDARGASFLRAAEFAPTS